jgi:hypothetical protein
VGAGAGGAGGGGNGGGSNGGGGGVGNDHARSISAPPSEAARNGHHLVGVPMSVDDGLHSMHLSLGCHRFGVGMGRLHSIFGSSSSSAAASGSTEDQRFQLEKRQSRTIDPQRLGVTHSPTSPSGISHHRQRQHHHQQHPPTPTPTAAPSPTGNTTPCRRGRRPTSTRVRVDPAFPCQSYSFTGWCCYFRFAALVIVAGIRARELERPKQWG